MAMTLQDVIDAAKTCPEMYCRGGFVRGQKRCPIAMEVLPDWPSIPEWVVAEQLPSPDPILEAAQRLGCTSDEVYAFMAWWDDDKPATVNQLRRHGWNV